jgi:hypothetical protein
MGGARSKMIQLREFLPMGDAERCRIILLIRAPFAFDDVDLAAECAGLLDAYRTRKKLLVGN